MRTPQIAVDVTPILAGGTCGGAKPFVMELLRGLAAKEGGPALHLLTASHSHDEFADLEAHGATRQIVDGLRAPLGLRGQGIEVLFCPMTAPTFAEPGVATVCTLYDLQHLAYPWFFTPEEIAHRNSFYSELVKRADHVACISEFSRQRLIEHLPIAPERTSTVPITIHHRLEAMEEERAWQTLSGRALRRCRFAFYPANFWPHKNHRMLLVAFARFLAEHPESPLHLVLTGELLDQGAFVAAGLHRMGIADRVHALGFVTEQEMSALWSVAEFLVFPSLYEGFGIPVLEAMHFGKPVLCSREGSLPEVGGDSVTYFDARDPQSIVEALHLATAEGPELRARAKAAQAQLTLLDPMTAVNRYSAIFENVAAARQAREGFLTESAQRIAWPLRETFLNRRRAKGTALMRAGRAAVRQGRRVSGAGRALAGAFLALDVAADAALKPVIGRALKHVGRYPLVNRWIVPRETKPWLKRHSLHTDGWAGPTLVVELAVEPGHTHVMLDGSGAPHTMVLSAFIDGHSLGERIVPEGARFELSWPLHNLATGQQTVTILANGFVVPAQVFGGSDHRPLSYRLVSITTAAPR